MDSQKTNQETIMIVDDDETVRAFIRFTLKSEGFQVIEERSAISALKTLEDKIPDLILLDIMMPQMDGYTMCTTIRKNPTLSFIPVIFVTSYAEQESLKKAREVGAQGFIEKPFVFEDFMKQIRSVLSGHFAMPTHLRSGASS